MPKTDKLVSKLEEYLTIPSVVGFEHNFLDFLARSYSNNYEVDKRKSLLVINKKEPNSEIVSVHIDRHGIVLNSNNQFEYAAFNAKKKYYLVNDAGESLLKKSGERFIGEKVFAYESDGRKVKEGLVQGFSYDVNSKELLFEINGLDNLSPNTPVAYCSNLQKIVSEHKTLLSSQIDNVVSVVLATQLLEEGFKGRILFSTEEEIGNSWRHVLDYLLEKRILSNKIFNLDTTPYENENVVANGLVVLRNKDQHGIFNSELVQQIRNICAREHIPFEFKDEVIEAENAKAKIPKKLGTTELGRIVESTNGRYNGATIQIPSLNYHSNKETTSLLCLENYYNLVKNILL